MLTVGPREIRPCKYSHASPKATSAVLATTCTREYKAYMQRNIFLFACLTLAFAAWGLARASEMPNVLFIAIDDLNHWVGHLNRNPQTRTPNIDRFARSGVAFTHSYRTAPACNPSRASLMSGLRPSSTGCYLNEENWR